MAAAAPVDVALDGHLQSHRVKPPTNDSLVTGSSPFDPAVLAKWPLPTSVYPPFCSSLLWDEFGEREIHVMYESMMDNVDTGVRERTVLYSTLSPPGLFVAVDGGPFHDPPHAAGEPYDPQSTWPLYDPSWLRISPDDLDDETTYTKHPLPYSDAHNFILEIETQEFFRHQSTTHPNMPVYLGCEVDRGWVVGVVLRRYPRTLRDAVENGVQVDIPGIMAQLEDVVKYLHSLGVVHNDINPSNIMLTDDLRPILIDYDTCLFEGDPLIDKSGTPGFNEDGTWTTSEFANDEHGLRCVAAWLETQSRRDSQ
ncbi:hypothetical protein EXIGLDRAFT_733932 [Exidia glandulosa HHB12029]|uniref:Protein kinase domain-containing protein n=1 Tax=Exidia glandulosa HHB12029 TaxID=1314781 RepID=A0A165KBZ8_EXIGL|nr:hypothetical protein EXIGLDRAFT_733932 [Exidia glandulosa HHB12029]